MDESSEYRSKNASNLVSKKWLTSDWEGWQDWDGGEVSPVPMGTVIGYEARGCYCLMKGKVNENTKWKHDGKEGDIVRYNITENQEWNYPTITNINK